ncbi:MAG: DNA polymerase III subunit beta [Bacillota bacterium]
MKLSFKQEQITPVLQTVQRVVSPRTTLPVLTGVLISGQGGKITLSATDHEVAIEAEAPGQVIEEGAVVLPARYLGDIVRRIPGGDVTLETGAQGKSATIRWGRSHYLIHGFSAEEFPTLGRFGQDNMISLNRKELRELVERTVFSVSHDDTRPMLTGALLEMEEGKIRLVATDGVRMALKEGPLDGADRQQKAIIPGRALTELSRTLGELVEENVLVGLDGGQFILQSKGMHFRTRTIDGQFPNYRQVIPKDFKTFATLQTSEYLAACERSSVLAQEGGHAIRLDFKGESLTITANAPEVGNVQEEIAATVVGESMQIAFNVKYLIEGLKNIGADEVDFQMTGPISPAVMKAKGRDDLIYVILPLRTV